MIVSSPKAFFTRIAERESLQPDLHRGFRCLLGFMIPLLVIHQGWLKLDPTYVCITAQSIGMIDVRGAYSFRLGLLLTAAIVLTGAVALGTLAGGSLPLALLFTVFIAIGGGLWRHLSSEYGPPIAIMSGLVFFIALSGHITPGLEINHHHVIATLCGGLFGTLLQVAYWPFRPQHPLRRAVADSWVALSDLFAALSPQTPRRQQAIADHEAALRGTLDKTYGTLAASSKRKGKLLGHLDALNLAAARLAMRVVAFNTALELLMDKPGFGRLSSALEPALTSLTNISRTVALAVVSRQPSHLATFEVRYKRLLNLLSVLQTQVKSQLDDPAAGEQLTDIIRQIEHQLPVVRDALRATIERADERAAFSLELFDLQTWTLRPLASALNLNPRVDSSLVRHTIRLSVLTLLGVLVWHVYKLPHGYWLPFTMLVVMQPDYGSTRQRAAQRMAGTIAGSLLASSLLWLHPSFPVLMAAIAVTIFFFGYYLKRRYGVAVVFITLNIVLLTESTRPVTMAFTLERVGSTLAGGLCALLAAFIFWPVWERSRFPSIMIKALSANRRYLAGITGRLISGTPYDDEAIQRKRAAESANSDVFSSLHRMVADPRNQQEGLEQAAALANGNQRATRALTVIALHLNHQQTRHRETLHAFQTLCFDAFDALILCEESGRPAPELRAVLNRLEKFKLPLLPPDHSNASQFREPWVFPQLSRIITELSAMLLAAAANTPQTTVQSNLTRDKAEPETGSA